MTVNIGKYSNKITHADMGFALYVKFTTLNLEVAPSYWSKKQITMFAI